MNKFKPRTSDIDEQLVYFHEGALAANGKKSFRIAPYEQTFTHIDEGTRVKFRVEIRSYGISTMQARVWEIYQAIDPTTSRRIAFAGDVIRNLDRSISDRVILVDPNTTLVGDGLGTPLWGEGGTVNEIDSPVFTTRPIPADDLPFPGASDNRYDWLLEVENKEGGAFNYTVEIYAELIPPTV